MASVEASVEALARRVQVELSLAEFAGEPMSALRPVAAPAASSSDVDRELDQLIDELEAEFLALRKELARDHVVHAAPEPASPARVPRRAEVVKRRRAGVVEALGRSTIAAVALLMVAAVGFWLAEDPLPREQATSSGASQTLGTEPAAPNANGGSAPAPEVAAPPPPETVVALSAGTPSPPAALRLERPSEAPIAVEAPLPAAAPEASRGPAIVDAVEGERPLAPSAGAPPEPLIAADDRLPETGAGGIQTSGALTAIEAALPAAEPRSDVTHPSPTRPVAILRRIEPRMPIEALGGDRSAVVEVHVAVDLSGRVKDARAVGGPAALRIPAEDTVRRWTFAPAFQDGEAVESSLRVTMTFGPAVRDMRFPRRSP